MATQPKIGATNWKQAVKKGKNAHKTWNTELLKLADIIPPARLLKMTLASQELQAALQEIEDIGKNYPEGEG
jgi:uncharacterized membrane protein YfbV (UPF0208 family)